MPGAFLRQAVDVTAGTSNGHGHMRRHDRQCVKGGQKHGRLQAHFAGQNTEHRSNHTPTPKINWPSGFAN